MGEGDDNVYWYEKEGGFGGIFTCEDLQKNHYFESRSENINDVDSGSKRIRLSPTFGDKDGEADSSARSNPIGLKLSKTPSFLNLLEMRLSKGKQADTSTQDNHAPYNYYKNSRTRKVEEKLKASNFPAIFIAIGAWQRITMHEGDLTAKLYYAKRKLVWEVLDGGFKSKMEIQWLNISAIRATTVDNEPGTLELELSEPPLFYREANPQPRKHTLWQHATDFTGGQAPIWRRHCVRFPPGILDKHYEMLLQCDQRLFTLSQKPFPAHDSPYFDPTIFGFSQYKFNRLITSRLQYPETLSVANFSGGRNNQFVTNQNHTVWDQGGNFSRGNINIQDNQVYNLQNYQSNVGLLNNIESHLLGDSQVVCFDKVTLSSKVDSMCSMLDPTDVMNVNNNANHPGTNYQISDGTTYQMMVQPDLEYQYSENIVPPLESNNLATMEQSMNNTVPTFMFHGHPTNVDFSHI
ncbi:hypothetical protein BUALT_Bualt15G0114100 [Buddleja alternifolia]|uniref:TRF2/HOY1 PH-like domain-containing protein n=1 Tax=Buddleja alternifolia TaxID=168488 RepID=A0AAV6WM50_9LAMI|nr:hypothetical protein BUALT_Bualt15G0114100 [Buddleja alternifolia]